MDASDTSLSTPIAVSFSYRDLVQEGSQTMDDMQKMDSSANLAGGRMARLAADEMVESISVGVLRALEARKDLFQDPTFNDIIITMGGMLEFRKALNVGNLSQGGVGGIAGPGG
jgi:hypothetical protein